MSSSTKKKNLVYPLITGLSIIALIYLLVSNRTMHRQNEHLSIENAVTAQQISTLRGIISLDTLLQKDQYEQAYEATQKLRGLVADSSLDQMFAMREDMILQMQKNWRKVQPRPSLPVITSLERSSRLPVVTRDSSINSDSLLALQDKLDSISFALQKAELFADKLQVQVDENTAGNYLSFNSRKGNSVYYVGDMKNGKAHGTGVGLLSTGSRYEGQWKNNQKHGKGLFQWQDGAYYNGDYKNDFRHGAGTYYWPDGQRFEGRWEKDVRSGEGTFYDAKGKVVAEGLWRDDELVKRKKDK